MFDQYREQNEKSRENWAMASDYEWLNIVEMHDIPHWLCGIQIPTRYMVFGFEFEIQYSADESCWQYVCVANTDSLYIASPIYPAHVKSGQKHFRNWVFSKEGE